MTEKQLSNEEKAKMSEVLAQKGSSLARIGMSVAQILQAIEERKEIGQLSKEEVEVYNQIMSNEEVKKFLEKTSKTQETSKTPQTKENNENVLEKTYDFLKENVQDGLDAVADSLETGWNAIKDGVEHLNPFASNGTLDKSEPNEQKNQKTLEKANILQKGSSLAVIGMSVAQALQALEGQKQTGLLSKEDVEVYNKIMSNEEVKKFLEKTSKTQETSKTPQTKENNENVLEKTYDFLKENVQDGLDAVADGVVSGWNTLKDGVEYLNSFTTNDTLKSSAQKVDLENLQQDQIIKDTSNVRS